MAADDGALTIYSDLPIDGPQKLWMTSIENGEFLALDQARSNRHDLNVNLIPLDDGSTGGWDPSDAQNVAVEASNDLDAVAYIGDYDSGATATSLPITNRADLLQVSPLSSYVGLTDANPVDTIGEPGRYYPSGVRTFARLVPSDVKEAVATVRFMRSLNLASVYVLADDSPYDTPFDSAIAQLVSRDAAQSGITLAGSAQIDTASTVQPAGYAGVAAAIAASNASAVFVAAAPGPGAVALWQELFNKLPGVALFAPSTLGVGPFLDKLGAATTDTYVTTPILPLSQYPRGARAVLKLYHRIYGIRPTAGTLYGYEAMQSVLKAINVAAKHATTPSRLQVVQAYFHLGTRYNSVIGRYFITPHGDTSLTKFAGDSVNSSGYLTEMRRLNART